MKDLVLQLPFLPKTFYQYDTRDLWLEKNTNFKAKPSKMQLVQTHKLIGEKEVLNKDNIENILLKIEWMSPVKDRGVVSKIAEILANQLFERTMQHYINDWTNYQGRIIRENHGFLINIYQNYIAKVDEIGERVFLLKDKNNRKRQEDNEDSKHGFSNEGEFDGLYLLKKKHRTQKNQRLLLGIETKSSEIKLKTQQVIKSTQMLSKMWDCPAHYVLIGFKEDIYIGQNKENCEKKYNILKPEIQTLHQELLEQEIQLIPIHFPFSKDKFHSFLARIEEDRTGIINVSGQYDTKTGKILLKDYWGNKINAIIEK